MSHLFDDFIKSNNGLCDMHTCARASKQKYLSIYIFFTRKTFLKTAVYIYIYIYTVLSLTQEESLRARERGTTNRILLVTTYNPHTSFIAEIANRNWHFLQSKERLARIFEQRPLIAYRRPKSLRDTLVSSKLRSKTTGDHTTTTGDCGPCKKPKCSWCIRINKTSTFTGTQDTKVFDIFHTVNCQSTFVIYIIECKICKLQYVGKSETAFNL